MTEKIRVHNDNDLLPKAERRAEFRSTTVFYVAPVYAGIKMLLDRSGKDTYLIADRDVDKRPPNLRNAILTELPVYGRLKVSFEGGVLPVTLGFANSLSDFKDMAYLYEALQYQVPLLPKGYSREELLARIDEETIPLEYQMPEIPQQVARKLEDFEDDFHFHFMLNRGRSKEEELCDIEASLLCNSEGTVVVFDVQPNRQLNSDEEHWVKDFIAETYSATLSKTLKELHITIQNSPHHNLEVVDTRIRIHNVEPTSFLN